MSDAQWALGLSTIATGLVPAARLALDVARSHAGVLAIRVRAFPAQGSVGAEAAGRNASRALSWTHAARPCGLDRQSAQGLGGKMEAVKKCVRTRFSRACFAR